LEVEEFTDWVIPIVIRVVELVMEDHEAAWRRGGRLFLKKKRKGGVLGIPRPGQECLIEGDSEKGGTGSVQKPGGTLGDVKSIDQGGYRKREGEKGRFLRA